MTLNATYSFNLPFNISSEAGARYYNVNDRYGYLSDSKWQPETLGSNGQKTEDNVTAAYLSLGKNGKKFTYHWVGATNILIQRFG